MSSVHISNASLALLGSIGANNHTIWNGTVSGAFAIGDAISASATVDFDTVNGVRKLHAEAAFSTPYIDVDVAVDYTADPVCVGTYSLNDSLAAYDPTTFVGQVCCRFENMYKYIICIALC